MSRSATERARRQLAREEAKEAASRAFARALAESGATQTEVADACSVARQKAQRWADPHAGEVRTRSSWRAT